MPSLTVGKFYKFMEDNNDLAICKITYYSKEVLVVDMIGYSVEQHLSAYFFNGITIEPLEIDDLQFRLLK